MPSSCYGRRSGNREAVYLFYKKICSNSDPKKVCCSRNSLSPQFLSLEAGAVTADGEVLADAIEKRLSTGRAFATPEWIAEQGLALGRQLAPQKPGRKPKQSVS